MGHYNGKNKKTDMWILLFVLLLSLAGNAEEKVGWGETQVLGLSFSQLPGYKK